MLTTNKPKKELKEVGVYAKRNWSEKRSTPKNIQLESHAQKKSLKVTDIMTFFHKTPILVKKSLVFQKQLHW